MSIQTPVSAPALASFTNRTLHGNCIEIMQRMPAGSVDFALTDPPYLVNYRSRDGRRIANDNANDTGWLFASMRELHRVLKPNSLALCMYGWPQVDTFMSAWRQAGFRPVGHISFHKRYASSRRYLAHHQESAFLLAKGNPTMPARPVADVQPFYYSGNHHHPTEKHPKTWLPLIQSLTRPNDVIIDPFAGSASTALAARALKRQFVAIELDEKYAGIAAQRLAR